MNRAVFLVLLLATMASCKKAEPALPSGQTATRAPAAPATGPLTVIPDAVVVPDTGDVNATLGQLSMELRRHVLRSKSSPKSFEEFAARAHLQAPPPPAGKKYAIAGGAVILAGQ